MAPEAAERDRAPEPTDGDPAPAEETTPGTSRPARPPRSRGGLKRRRARLLRRREELQFHVGGLVTEMVSRGTIAPKVLSARAQEVIELESEIQLLEWRLQALELERRQRKGTAPPVAGSCLSCGADFAPESLFCWRCGARFAAETESEAATTTEIGMVQQP